MNLRQVVNLVSLAVVLVVNSLANVLPLNGKTTGDISDQFSVYFTPAGYVFSIWSLIYLGLIAFGIYQALPSQRDNPRLKRVGPWFAISNLLNSAWIFLWHYEQFILTMVVMLGLLASLVVIYLRLMIGREGVPFKQLLLINLPFSIYLGWISVATIANASVVLHTLGWDGWGLSPVIWTEIMIMVAAILAFAIVYFRKDLAFALVFIWASVGIAVRNLDVTPIYNVASLAAVGVAFSVLVFFTYRLNKRRESGSAQFPA